MTLSTISATPGRPREFEIDEAIESAMQVFWSRGYNATSLVDLIEGTGLSRGSLYKAFGDKRALFLAALERYTSNASKGLVIALQQPGPSKVVIRECLMRFATSSCGTEGRRGCMLIATATEMVPHDAQVSDCVAAMYERIRSAYADAIARGQASGEIARSHDAQTLARLIVCLTLGMRVVGKTGATQQEMNPMVDAAMALFD
ncbi:MAG: TetR/AcrR family transcriptional regulator [Pseudomonas sp.]|nr:TetR/AcrR family transcriptional regulator [Pseudomonas sp.]